MLANFLPANPYLVARMAVPSSAHDMDELCPPLSWLASGFGQPLSQLDAKHTLERRIHRVFLWPSALGCSDFRIRAVQDFGVGWILLDASKLLFLGELSWQPYTLNP